MTLTHCYRCRHVNVGGKQMKIPIKGRGFLDSLWSLGKTALTTLASNPQIQHTVLNELAPQAISTVKGWFGGKKPEEKTGNGWVDPNIYNYKPQTKAVVNTPIVGSGSSKPSKRLTKDSLNKLNRLEQLVQGSGLIRY